MREVVREKNEDGRRLRGLGNAIPTDGPRSEVVSIWEVHHQVARFAVMGYNNRQIGEILGLSAHRVSVIKNSPMIIRLMEMLKSQADQDVIDIRKQIQEFAPRALEVVKDVVENDQNSPGLRANYAMKMMGLAGHVAPKNVNVHSVNTNLSADQIKTIRERAAQIGMNSGLIVDESTDPN